MCGGVELLGDMATARDVFSLSGTARENEISVLDREVQEGMYFSQFCDCSP